MRTMMIANSLVTADSTVKGALGVKDTNGAYTDMTALLANTDKQRSLQLVNFLGNGSIKTFEINPFNFSFTSKESGTLTKAIYTFSYPSGNVSYIQNVNIFQGGIVIKRFDTDKNVFKTEKIIDITLNAPAGVLAYSAVKTAIVAALAKADIAAKYIFSVASTDTVYTLKDMEVHIELTGDCKYIGLVKTPGIDNRITGTTVQLADRETASNSGYHHSEEDNDLYAMSNFIADPSLVYDVVTIVSKGNPQRVLLPNAGGFDTVCNIYTPADAGVGTALHALLKTFFGKLLVSPTGAEVVNVP